MDRSYLGDTLILRTTFTTDTGIVQLIDCLTLEKDSDPKRPRAIHPHEVLVRIVECVKGEVEMECDFQPRFDYGGILPWFREHGEAVEAVGGPEVHKAQARPNLTVRTTCPVASYITYC